MMGEHGRQRRGAGDDDDERLFKTSKGTSWSLRAEIRHNTKADQVPRRDKNVKIWNEQKTRRKKRR